jgi:glucose/arabinose dehydrogenase
MSRPQVPAPRARAALLLSLLPWVPPAAAQEPNPAQESDYYAVDYLVPPPGERLEVGGLGFLPNGRLVVSTRRGQVWIVHDPLAPDPRAARFSLFAEGLQEGLGLSIVGERIFVLQRAELSELVDHDRDGRCDEVRSLASDWGVSGHYHEFAFGLPRDGAGNFYVSLNVSFGDPQWWHGRSTAPWRGWVLQLTPEGRTVPFASGLRSPCGLCTNSKGDLFLTDNQGDWMPACPIFHVREGRFYGHPASLNWTPAYREAGRTASDTIPPTTPREPAAVWIPYDWSRSAGNLVEDTTGGKFGPFAGQMFVAELTNGMLLRVLLEQVRGEYQGAVIPFRRGVGSAVRVGFAPDGTLFAGFTDRGWGGQAPGDGLGRIRPTGRVPLEIQDVHLVEGGFEVGFTLPLAQAPAAPQIQLLQYDYDYWWEYGSPARHTTHLAVEQVELSPDHTRLRFAAPLRAGMCARVRFEGLVSQSGERLLHEEFAYTVNQLTSGPVSKELVAKQVPPPPAKERSAEGMLELSWGKALDSWRQTGWSARRSGAAMDPTDRRRLIPWGELESWEETSVLQNDAAPDATPSELVSRYEFGDVEVHADFMLPEGGNSGLYLMGRYEVQLLDSSGKSRLDFGDCGGLYQAYGEGARWPGRAPMFNAFRGPGQWHGLTVRFRAPKFDASGVKVSHARFERVMIDDVLLHENVEVPEPTRGGLVEPREVAQGPLRFQGDHGSVALKNVWVRPLPPGDTAPAAERGSVDLLVLPSPGWTPKEGELLVGEDGAGDQLFAEDPGQHSALPPKPLAVTDARLSFEARIARGATAAVFLRAGAAESTGYGLFLAASPDAPQQAGSLIGFAPIEGQLVPANLWCRVELVVQDEAGGTRISSFLNGVKVAEALDGERRFAQGGLRIQGPKGGVLELRGLRLERLGGR